MRGWTSDFTSYEPVAPVAVRALPRDFDPRGHDDFLDAPRAAELVECDRCDWRTCNRLIRAEGRTVKPDCAAFLVMDVPQLVDARRVGPAEVRAAIRRALRDGKTLTLRQIMAATNLKYHSARNYVAEMTQAGALTCVGERVMRKAGGREKLYRLTEGADE